MLEDRNASTHVYDQREAGEIYAGFVTFTGSMKALIARLEKGRLEPSNLPSAEIK